MEETCECIFAISQAVMKPFHNLDSGLRPAIVIASF